MRLKIAMVCAHVGKELTYMRANSSFSGVQLQPGTEPFNADIVSAIIGA